MAAQIDLYTDQTPNGQKITIALEELGLQYKVHHIDISTGKQKEPWFLKINPNGRIPAITDTRSDGKVIRVFEGGSILQYLTDTYDVDNKISYPRGSPENVEVNNWIWFQAGGIGPMQGQSHHFLRYAPEKIEYGIDRYMNETRRLYRVLENHLKEAGSSYLVGEKLTIADIATFPWISIGKWGGVEIDDFPNLEAWLKRIAARPAVEKGRNIPSPDKLAAIMADPEKLKAHAAKGSKWVVEGMKADAKK